jgi:hypothetical protein
MAVLAASSSIMSGSLGIYRHYLFAGILIVEAILFVALVKIKRRANRAT